MAVSYQDYLNARVSPAVYGLTLAALRAGGAPDDSALSETDKTKAFLTVFNTIQGLTKERPETVQADTERLWGTLSGRHKHEIAANPGAATSIVAEAMRGDPALAGKLPEHARAVPSGDGTYFDASGRDPFDRLVVGNRLPGYYSGSVAYSGLAGTTYDPARGLSSLTPQNFDSSPFKAAGLDYTTTRMLATQGFGPQAIMAAASLTGSLGIDVKTNVAAVARLTRDVPSAETGLRQTKRNWDAVGQLEAEAKKGRDRGDAETADRLQREADEARRRAEEHDRRERDRARAANPDREQDLIGVQQQIRDQALKAARDAKIDPALIERMRQGDPAAKEEFDRIVEGIKAGTDPKARAGVEQVQEAIDADKKLSPRLDGLIEKRNGDKALASKKEDDLLAGILGDPAPANPTQQASADAKEGEPPAAAPVVTAENTDKAKATVVASADTATDENKVKTRPKASAPSATV